MCGQAGWANHSTATNGRFSGHLPAVKWQWKGRCWADKGCIVQSLCLGHLHNIQTLCYPDINGRRVNEYLLCNTKESGGSVWRITWTDFCIRVHGWNPGLGETTIEGVYEHWSNADWTITWTCMDHHQGWSRTRGAGCNSCADGPEWPYNPTGWTHAPEWIASVVDGLVTSLRIAQTKDVDAYAASDVTGLDTASNCPGNEPGDKISASLCSGHMTWTRRNQSSNYTLTKRLARRF